MSLPLFKDIGKRVSDLLTKDFPSDKKEQRVELKSTTSQGVKVEGIIKNEEIKDSPKSTGTVKYESFKKEWNTKFTGEVTTDNTFKTEATYSVDRYVSGLKGIFTFQKQGTEPSVVAGFEYKKDSVSATGSIETGKKTDNALKTSVVFGSKNVAVGANVDATRKDTGFDVKEFKAALSYASDEIDAVVYGKVTQVSKAPINEVGLSYYQKLNSETAVGGETKYNFKDEKPTLALGSYFKLQPSSTLKSKFDTTGKLGLSWTEALNKNTTVQFSSTIDTKASSKNSSIGAVLTYTS